MVNSLRNLCYSESTRPARLRLPPTPGAGILLPRPGSAAATDDPVIRGASLVLAMMFSTPVIIAALPIPAPLAGIVRTSITRPKVGTGVLLHMSPTILPEFRSLLAYGATIDAGVIPFDVVGFEEAADSCSLSLAAPSSRLSCDEFATAFADSIRAYKEAPDP